MAGKEQEAEVVDELVLGEGLAVLVAAFEEEREEAGGAGAVAGAGSARRSSLPFSVSGSAASATKALGIM